MTGANDLFNAFYDKDAADDEGASTASTTTTGRADGYRTQSSQGKGRTMKRVIPITERYSELLAIIESDFKTVTLKK